MRKKSRESEENYLRLIHELDEGQGVKSVDIAKNLEITKSSVSEMLRKLAGKNLIKLKPYSKIKLTEKGKKLAENFHEKHDLIKTFIKKLCSYDEEKSKEQAHILEHAFSQESTDILKTYLEGRVKLIPGYVG